MKTSNTMKHYLKDDLIKVAKELQELCEFEPPIKTKGKTYKELEKLLKEAHRELIPDDPISDLAMAVFKQLGFKALQK